MYSNTRNLSDLNDKILASLEEVDQCLPGIIDAAVYYSVSLPEETEAFRLYSLTRRWFCEITPAVSPNEYLSNLKHLITICEHSNQQPISRELKKLHAFLSDNMTPFSKILKELHQARLFTGVRDNYLNN